MIAELLQRRRAVLLGEPGGGKTAMLRKLAQELLTKARQDQREPLPLLVHLGDWRVAKQTLADFIKDQLGEQGDLLNDLIFHKRAALLLDGLNELPVDQRPDKYKQVREYIVNCKKANANLLAVVCCREQDYKDTDLGLDRITISPLDPLRIRSFVEKYLKGDELFWALIHKDTSQTHKDASQLCDEFRQEFAGQVPEWEQVFWNETHLPAGCEWGWRNSNWERWIKQRDDSSSLLVLARNPYMLLMLSRVYTPGVGLPANRGKLFEKFVSELFARERRLLEKNKLEQQALREKQEQLKGDIPKLAFEMQKQRVTSLAETDALSFLRADQLRLARDANLLNISEPVSFSHQLLQEYFAAQYMDIEYKARRLHANKLWPGPRWWERTNWEEAAVLWAGLYTDDCSEVVKWIAEANPEVAAQCIVRSDARTPDATKDELEAQWLPRLWDLRREPDPLARAAVGRALGLIDRHLEGSGVKDGLPDIKWITIPAGEFQYGNANDDYKPQELFLPTFEISRFPITYAQFQTFVDDPQGIANRRWFEGLTEDENERQVSQQYFKYYEFPYTNPPRETVSWYQAMAFCRWLSWRWDGGYDLQQVDDWAVRLPTEFEWEKAARGTDGRLYPYEGEFDAAKGNTDKTGIWQTSAVGIFPNGKSPYEVEEMSGNVWEWCLSSYNEPATKAREENLRTDDSRVLRGGSWISGDDGARAVSRKYNYPRGRDFNIGFRVCRWVRPPS